MLKIFLVEDDEFTSAMLKHYLSMNPDNDVEVFETGKDCLNNLTKGPDVICLDYYLPDVTGEEILKVLKNKVPETPVIIVSGQEDIQTAVKLLKDGAYDYVVKDDNFKERLWNIINHIRRKEKLTRRLNQLEEEVGKKYDLKTNIIGESPAIKKIFPLIDKACKSEIIVSVTGETGTGKEVVAKTIHYNSRRKEAPFVPVNMAAIPKDLLESELFGHEKGAFTGAVGRRAGKFEEAQGGTIFLDEIGDMDIAMQVKLLRVLQEQEVVRVGGNKTIKLDVRVIIATHKNLVDEVKKGNFREDLYYRLLGITINLPPLRERGNDIILLAKFFAEDYRKRNNLEAIKFSKNAIDKLLSHDYPGNVRELKSTVELAVVMAEGNEIKEEDIQIRFSSFFNELTSAEMTLEDYNVEIVKHFLRRYNNKVRLVADKLGIGKSTIYRMLQSHMPEFLEKDNH